MADQLYNAQQLFTANQAVYIKGIHDGIKGLVAFLKREMPVPLSNSLDSLVKNYVERFDQEMQEKMPVAFALYSEGQQYADEKMKAKYGPKGAD